MWVLFGGRIEEKLAEEVEDGDGERLRRLRGGTKEVQKARMSVGRIVFVGPDG